MNEEKKKRGRPAKSTEVAIVPTEVGAKDLATVMQAEAEKRTLVTKYISVHMKDGTDYGTIRFGSKESKPSLFKPGSEKFLSLFRLTARFEKDADTWEMAGSEAGVFAYKCLLYASNGTIVGEGRGVSNLSEKAGWTINNAVKIAEKRAQIDAVLRTGALSDFFTQDLEDMVQAEPMKPYAVPRKVPPADDEAGGAVIKEDTVDEGQILTRGEIAEVQKDQIRSLLASHGYEDLTKAEAQKAVKEITELDLSEQKNWEEIIKRLRDGLDAVDPLAQVLKQ